MSDVVIRAEGLGKKYTIGHQTEREANATLRDVMTRSLRNWGRSARDMFAGKALLAGDETEEFWALKNINFEIKRSDVVGIIGRNGAGKSTLLKVLSRITEPTTGRVTICGRVASLLEVGTGFHGELSGRENIYLNGAILGMTRMEIRRKFDEIVDFSGVEKFIDTPVKRYSSGMYVRLAFAVAAHLDPEILIVDEVLAVGDAEFQKKCLGKMQDIAGHGRTILFVSHNISAVRNLCNKAILLTEGEVRSVGKTEDVIDEYLTSDTTSIVDHADESTFIGRRSESADVRFISFRIFDHKNQTSASIGFKEEFTIKMIIECKAPISNVTMGFSFVQVDGQELMGSSAHDNDLSTSFTPGMHEILVRCLPNVLLPGTYTLRAAIFKPGVIFDHIDEIMRFEIHPSSRDSRVLTHSVGLVHLTYPWTVKKI